MSTQPHELVLSQCYYGVDYIDIEFFFFPGPVVELNFDSHLLHCFS